MSSALPPLDLHAHIDPAISSVELQDLRAVVFVATRSLSEARAALRRQDGHTVWGVGSHPAIAESHNTFDVGSFRSMISESPFVSEFGLDGGATVPLERQLRTLRAALDVLVATPRVTSLHSYRATSHLLDELQTRTLNGIVLHWWQGDEVATKRAVELGCYFSVNAAMFRRAGVLRSIPRGRLLTETDHPYGDRVAPQPRPGNVVPVEHALARMLKAEPDDIRRMIWRNFDELIRETECARLLPRRIRSYLIAAGSK